MRKNKKVSNHSDVLSRLISPLGLTQVATLLSLIILVFCVVIYIRHMTEDYFIPLDSYLLSLKIALPPAAIFATTYILAVVTGTPISEAPKTVLGFVRNQFFQSPTMMILTIFFVAVFGVYTAWTVAWRTPPAYESFVRLILNGGSDNLTLAKAQVVKIRKDNPKAAEVFSKIIEVFDERTAVNGGGKKLSGERARVFVRSLEAESSHSWGVHPLHRQALAESYLLLGQSITRAAEAVGAAPAESSYRRAIALYDGVATDSSSLAPQVLRLSARNNIGNAYYYLGDNMNALTAWRLANSSSSGQQNLNSWGNIIAALVTLDRPKEAIEEGDKARTWAEKTGKALVETFPFAGILENTAFARLQVGDFDGALSDFATAYAFREDDLTRQNLAIALILNRRYEESQKILRQIAPPLSTGGDTPTKADRNIASCVYFIWGLAMAQAPLAERAVNFTAFLGEKTEPRDLSSMSDSMFVSLLRRVDDGIERSDFPCRSLRKIKAIRNMLLVQE